MTGFDIESIVVQQCQHSGPKRSTGWPTRRNRMLTIPSRGIDDFSTCAGAPPTAARDDARLFL
jgi:hypothetical protein